MREQLRYRINHWIAYPRLKLEQMLPSCSLPGCCSHSRRWSLKRFQPGITLQGRWYCSFECFERGLAGDLQRRLRVPRLEPQLRNRIPLGLLMLSRGLIDHASLQSALDAQKKTGHRPLGACLLQAGAITEEDLAQVLGQQSGCPVFEPCGGESLPLERLPSWLCERYRVAPVRWSARDAKLWVAFAGPLRRALLYATENMLVCRCEPCIVKETTLEGLLAEVRRRPGGHNVVFEDVAPHEISAIARSYALQLRAEQVRWAVCGGDVWMRLSGAASFTDLLFGSGPRAVSRRH
jgi:hypothetical protein